MGSLDSLASAQLQLERAGHDSKPTKSNTDSGSRSYSLVGGTAGTHVDDSIIGDPFIAGLFSTKKPRDAGAGLASGVKSVSKGVAIGAASLVVCPVVGVSQDGLTGFFKGVGTGVLAAITLPLTGLGVAGYQISRGIINTPRAICQKAVGKKWNKETGQWTDNWYSLDEEANKVFSTVSSFSSDEKDSTRNKTGENGFSNIPVYDSTKSVSVVVETEFYEILDVPTNASQEAIRRSYYRLAKKYHPDKNSDEGSKEMFQRLGEAYQVLGDEERRKKYDLYGKSACSDMPILDSSLFFMMLFGSDAFEPYIGKLRMALFLELELNDALTPTAHDFEKLQTAREVKIALELREITRPFVCGDVINWKETVYEKAKALCKNSFSVEITKTIGWTYQNYAKQYLGKKNTFLGIAGKFAKTKEKVRSMEKSLRTFGSIMRTAIAERSLRKGKSLGDEHLLQEADLDNVCDENIPIILDAMLNICLMDVQNTVRAACKRLLKDMSVDATWRQRRAEALIEMGAIFTEVAKLEKYSIKVNGPSGPVDHFFSRVDEKRKCKNTHYSDDAFF